MCKSVCFLVALFLFGFPLSADPIQNLVITSLVASQSGNQGPVQFTASGPSVTISGSQGIVSPLPFVPVGTPLGNVSFILPPNGDPNLRLDGNIGGSIVQIESPNFGPVISGSTNLLIPENGALTFPGTVTGAYVAFACLGPFEAPPRCTGPQIAQIAVDLPGLITASFAPPFPGSDVTFLEGVNFAGSVPEPSTIGLVLLGAGAVAMQSMARRKTQVCW